MSKYAGAEEMALLDAARETIIKAHEVRRLRMTWWHFGEDEVPSYSLEGIPKTLDCDMEHNCKTSACLVGWVQRCLPQRHNGRKLSPGSFLEAFLPFTARFVPDDLGRAIYSAHTPPARAVQYMQNREYAPPEPAL